MVIDDVVVDSMIKNEMNSLVSIIQTTNSKIQLCMNQNKKKKGIVSISSEVKERKKDRNKKEFCLFFSSPFTPSLPVLNDVLPSNII